MDNDDKEKLRELQKAIQNLEGVPIPYNLIKDGFEPISEWLKGELQE